MADPYAIFGNSNGQYPAKPNHPDDGKPNTGAQILVDLYDGTMPRTPPSTTFTFKKARQMAKHPSIALAREYAIAPIVATEYAVEADVDAHGAFIEEQILDPGHLTHFLYAALYNEIDFGWSAFEIVFDAAAQLDSLKALLNDFTFARRDIATGDFIGLKTTDRFTGMWIYLDALHSLFVSHDSAGLGDYGTARLANVEMAYDAWLEAAATAARYDAKMAGGLTKIDYLPRRTLDKDGNETENFDIAMDAAKSMKASGIMIVPNEPQAVGDKSVKTFEVERIDASGGQADMTGRMKYLDALMFRGVFLPERALSESSLSGSRADSVAHADVALLCMQLKAQQLLDCLNHYLVDRLLMIRFGVTGTAKLVAQPLDDEKIAFMQKAFTTALADTAIGPDLINMMDVEAMMDTLGVPRLQNPPPMPEPIQPQQQPQQPPQQGANQ